jgi:hypothetical protein
VYIGRNLIEKANGTNQEAKGRVIWTMEEKETMNKTAFGKHTVKVRRRKDPNKNKSFPRIVQKSSNINGASTLPDSFRHFDSNFHFNGIIFEIVSDHSFRAFIRNLYLRWCLNLPGEANINF